MNKKLITALLITSTALNASTLIAPGVHLESERTWFTGNATGHFVHHDNQKLSGAFVTAQASSVYGNRNVNIMLTGSHSANIHNTSSHSERYTLLFQICTLHSCAKNARTFSLDAYRDYTASGESYLNTVYNQVGTYDIEAKTEITGDVNANDIGRASAIISR